MSATPSIAPSADTPAPHPARRWLNAILALFILGVIAMLLIPTYGSGPPSERAKTYFQLNNLISACTLYNQEYHQWPIFTTTPPGPNYILHLANSPRFIPIMTGNLSGHPELAKYNPHNDQFLVKYDPRNGQFVSFSKDDLNQNGRVVDPYGNDDLVLVMDTTPAKVTSPRSPSP